MKKHTRDGFMTPEYHALYMLAIKPLQDLHGTEHDLWQNGVRTMNPVWLAAEEVVEANIAALDSQEFEPDDEVEVCPTCGHVLGDDPFDDD